MFETETTVVIEIECERIRESSDCHVSLSDSTGLKHSWYYYVACPE
jgi:hypothetical protein